MEERYTLERALHVSGQGWLEGEYGRHITLDTSNHWRSPVRGDKRDYIARSYTDDRGRPRLSIVVHDHKTGSNTRFDDLARIDDEYGVWLERRRGKRDADYQRRRAEREARAAQETQARAERVAQGEVDAAAEERRRDATLAAEHAAWKRLPQQGHSAYLRHKGLPHAAPYRYEGQTLVVPLWNATGAFCGVQRVRRGNKLFTRGARKAGAFTVVGGAPELEGRLDLHTLPTTIAEGTATAQQLSLATGEPVICAFDAGNLGAVIDAIREALDSAGMEEQRRAWLKRLVIAADNDQWKQEQLHNGVALGNVGLEAAHRAALEHGCRVAVPDFGGLDVRSKPTDFDDLALLAGLDAVQAALEQATRADPNVAFARDRRTYLHRLKKQGATFERYLSLGELPLGATIICSPQNTGKTEALRPLIARYRAQGLRVLYVSHRVALAANAAERLGLETYDAYTAADLRAISGLAICLNSLHKLENEQGNLERFDVLVLDESEQLAAAVTGSHLREKRANLRVLSRLVERSARVVCLDADAGPLTWWMLGAWRGGEVVNRLENYYPVGAGRTAYVYPHRAQAYKQLGRGVFAATDGLPESRRMAFTFQAQGVTPHLINGETSHDPENLEFVRGIDKTAPGAEAIVCSPSLSTGVSITAAHFTRAVGVFWGGNGPASEALQAMWRPRQATEWHLWLDSRVPGESIDLEARYGAALDAELARAGNPSHLAPGNDYDYTELRSLVAERNQWGRRSFYLDALRQLVLQGFEVRLVDPPTEEEAEGLRQVLQEASERERAAYADERDGAEHLKHSAADALRERGTLTSGERFSLERYDHTAFFGNLDDPKLITWLRADYRARYRHSLERLELTIQDDDDAQTAVQAALEKVEMRGDVRLTLTRREFYGRVLEAVGFEAAAAAVQGELTAEELEAAAHWELESRAGENGNKPPVAARLRAVALDHFGRYSARSQSMRELVGWIEERRATLAGAVALPDPERLAANAVRYVSGWLKSLGLRQERAGMSERQSYMLDPAALVLASSVLERRQSSRTLSPKKAINSKSVLPSYGSETESTALAPPGSQAPPPTSAEPWDKPALERLWTRVTAGSWSINNADVLRDYLERARAGDTEALGAVLAYTSDPTVARELAA